MNNQLFLICPAVPWDVAEFGKLLLGYVDEMITPLSGLVLTFGPFCD
jgi:hypothetical protein